MRKLAKISSFQFQRPVPEMFPCEKTWADLVDDAEAPVAELDRAVEQLRHGDVAVPQDRVAGQRPVTGFDARRVEDHDFAPVEGHVAHQVAVSLVRAVELREPGVDVGIGDGHLVAVEFQHDVFALAGIEGLLGRRRDLHVVVPYRPRGLASVVGAPGESQAAADDGFALPVGHEIQIHFRPVVGAVGELRGIPRLFQSLGVEVEHGAAAVLHAVALHQRTQAVELAGMQPRKFVFDGQGGLFGAGDLHASAAVGTAFGQVFDRAGHLPGVMVPVAREPFGPVEIVGEDLDLRAEGAQTQHARCDGGE